MTDATNTVRERPYLGAFWGPRREPVQSCAVALEHCIAKFAAHSELLRHWYRLGGTRAEALSSPMPIAREPLAEELLEGRSRDDAHHAVVEDLGFKAHLWNGASDDDLAVTVRVTCGSWSEVPGLMNHITLDLGRAWMRRLDLPTGLALLTSVVESWMPDWAVVLGDRALRDAQVPKPGTPYVGWLTYLSPGRGDPGQLKGASVERIPNAGSIIVLAPRIDDVDVGHAMRTAETLRRAGVLRPTPTDRAVVESAPIR